jgi:glyoxylate/hydroxypyruvate reductase A
MPSATTAPSPIALIGRFAPGEAQSWLDALREAMPEEHLLPAESIADPSRVSLAIVANPDPAAVRRFTGLEWVQSLWAGVEKLVAEPAFEHLPIVRMIDPELGRTMAEAVLAWTLYLHRDMPAYLAQQRDCHWRQLRYVAPSARRVGILGMGVLGQAAARSLLGAGFTVQGWSRRPKQLDGIATFSGDAGLVEMSRQTDILVCLLPLTQQTRHLVDSRLLDRLPPRACVINFGRGPVLHTRSLVDALDSGHLAHAVLDVFDEEPLPAGSALWRHPAVTVLPHISADTDARSASRIVAANVRHWRQTGQVPPAVDRLRGY